MVGFSPDGSKKKQRRFPRVRVVCPVLYRVRVNSRWQTAQLVDFSATGVRIECDEHLPLQTTIMLQIKPGREKVVPALAAKAVVVRCELNVRQRFEVSCKIRKVLRNSSVPD
jgi:hypothetical protein